MTSLRRNLSQQPPDKLCSGNECSKLVYWALQKQNLKIAIPNRSHRFHKLNILVVATL